MARKIVLGVLLLVVAILPSDILLIKPESREALHINMSGEGMHINSPFPAPKNVSISLIPDANNPDSIRISWDAVEGAKEYQVYTAVAVKDTSVYVPYSQYIMDYSRGLWEYKYSFHPTYGDTYIINYNNGIGYQIPMWNRIVFSRWTLDSGSLRGTTFTRAYEGERDRFFFVRAVR